MNRSPRTALGLLTFPAMLTGTLAFQAWVGPALGLRDRRLVVFSILFGVLFGGLFPATLRRIHEGLREHRRGTARESSTNATIADTPPDSGAAKTPPPSQRSTILIPLDVTTAARLLPQDSVD